MHFQVVKTPPNGATPGAFLVTDEWDDYSFRTSFNLVYVDEQSQRLEVGAVKIGQVGVRPTAVSYGRPDIPSAFDSLDARYFSLGQGEDYYHSLNKLSKHIRDSILSSLRDCARDITIFDGFLAEPSMRTSLLRFITEETVRGRLHRLSVGQAVLTPFDFSYQLALSTCTLQFRVKPHAQPPTNVHALIGRNGVGKTRCLKGISRCLARRPANPESDGQFTNGQQFANIVSVAFSAFDPFEPIRDSHHQFGTLPYIYIGLKQDPTTASSDNGLTPESVAPKSVADLAADFADSVKKCRSGLKSERWRAALTTLSSDPVFQAANVLQLLNPNGDAEDEAKSLYHRLSSGHKIVLLTVTRLVDMVEEKSLILLDEPESHLHPPLLSAFIRCLSNLLNERNAVAIIATHSPVVLQEIPRSCAWVMTRSGAIVEATRPRIESFGENVGVLTSEVFGLEVSDSGFHQLLANACGRLQDYESVVAEFSGDLGAEALSIVRSMMADKRRGRSS